LYGEPGFTQAALVSVGQLNEGSCTTRGDRVTTS